MGKLKTFTIDSKELSVACLNTEQVKEGVECDIYSFAGDTTKDLAIVRVKPGYSTPLQKVISGEQTIEQYVSGEGRLMVKSVLGEITYFEFDSKKKAIPVIVNVGELMQWKATGDIELTFSEVCTPPYEKGRFEDQL